MPTDWNNVLLVFLHDPPDKVLSVHRSGGNMRHQRHARELAKAVHEDFCAALSAWLRPDQISRARYL